MVSANVWIQSAVIVNSILVTVSQMFPHSYSDSLFLNQFFTYFPNVSHKLSSECVNVSEYLRNHPFDDTTIKSKSFDETSRHILTTRVQF